MAFDWSDVLRAAWRHKAVVVAVFLLASTLFGSLYFFLPRQYESTALLLAEPDASVQITGSSPTSTLLQQDEYLSSQVQIILSPSVVLPAIESVGTNELADPQEGLLPAGDPSQQSQAGGRLYERVYDAVLRQLTDHKPETKAALVERAYESVLGRLSVRAEPKTYLIKLSYRSHQPEVASNFVNALVQSYLKKRTELSTAAAAATFAQRQGAFYEQKLDEASRQLSAFSSHSGIYSADDQQKLLLNRENALLSDVTATDNAIAEKEAQSQALAGQLSTMKLTNFSSQIAALARQTTSSASKRSAQQGGSSTGYLNGDPPLLLVRVYQDTVQNLVAVNSQLAGLRAVAQKQRSEFDDIRRQLAALAAERARFDQLTSNVQLARHNVDLLASKEVQEKLDAALNLEKISRIQIAQAATTPVQPVFPKKSLILAIAIAAGVILSSLLSTLLCWLELRQASLYEAAIQDADNSAPFVMRNPMRASFGKAPDLRHAAQKVRS